jgi:hypothetical protein
MPNFLKLGAVLRTPGRFFATGHAAGKLYDGFRRTQPIRRPHAQTTKLIYPFSVDNF